MTGKKNSQTESVGRIASKFPVPEKDEKPSPKPMLLIKLAFKCKKCGLRFPVDHPTATRTVVDREAADSTVKNYADELIKDGVIQIKCAKCQTENEFVKTDLGYFDA
jgi:DNA-directed RNA polymerase subunit M/transcription elongation factor TFIIS